MTSHSTATEDNGGPELPASHETLNGQLCVACGSIVTPETSTPVETPAVVQPARVLRRHLICPIPDWVAGSLV
jgi:hypothetical protein